MVTGGAGFIGRHLVDALRQAGHTVRVLDLRRPSDGWTAGSGCEFIQGSVADPGLVAQAVQGMEVVYHLAWAFLAWRSYSELRPDEERREIQENLLGTLNLLQAALTAGVRHLLFSGSAVVYGPTQARVGEEHPCHPERSTLGGPVYGITKLACEKLCLVYQRRSLPVTVFRLHGVFSADGLGQFGPMIRRALAGRPVQATRGAGGEYAHIDDVVRAFLISTDDPRAHGEVFNLAGSHTYRDPDVARYIVERAGSGSAVELVEDATQTMVSVSVEKLRRRLGYEPERGEFLTRLIREALAERGAG
jgi:nucleoside-diphosphate-sugar epimerase